MQAVQRQKILVDKEKICDIIRNNKSDDEASAGCAAQSERGTVGAPRHSLRCGHFRAGSEELHGFASVTGLTRCPVRDN